MQTIARVLWQLFVYGFAAVGFAICAYYFVLNPALQKAFDEGRVLEVIEAPSEREAAVIYFHDHQESSGKYLAVKLMRWPFPKVGGNIDPYDDVFRIVGTAEDWRDDQKPIRLQWWYKSKLSPVSLDVCSSQTTVRFDRGLYGDATTDVTLCEAPKEPHQ